MKVKVDSLNFSYNQKKALKNINFELEGGRVLALIGPNGSGKSTLLRCLNGILHADKGKVLLGDDKLSKMDRKDIAKRVAYVPQEQSSSFPLSVFDAILMGRKPYISWKNDEKDLEIVSEIISKLDLEDIALKEINKLSGGQRQKISIARALAQKGDILLLDEPTSNLDLKHQLEIINLIKKEAEKGVSVIVTVHDLSLVGKFSDKVMILNNGEIYAKGGREVLTAENIKRVYGVKVAIKEHGDNILIIPEKAV